MTKAESSAEELVFDLGLSLPIKPESVCDELNTDAFRLNYQEKQLSATAFLGLSIGNQSGAEIVVNASIRNIRRINFTAAHEIGHVIMHIQPGVQSEFSCSSGEIYGKEGLNIAFEKEANEFASALLMPKSLIGKSISRSDLSWSLIKSISKSCNTSLEATARRVIRLSSERCALIIHKNGEMWSPFKSPSFPAFINKTLIPNEIETYSDAADHELPDTFVECDTLDWLNESEGLPDTILYSSIESEAYSRIMTLILLQELDPDEEEIEWEEPTFHR